jgi:hypothetical protein
LVFGLIFLRKNFKPTKVLFLTVVGSLPLIFYFWLNSQSRYLSSEETLIYEGPSEIFKGQYAVPSGIFIMGKKKNDWVHIYYPSKFRGWVKKENLLDMELE